MLHVFLSAPVVLGMGRGGDGLVCVAAGHAGQEMPMGLAARPSRQPMRDGAESRRDMPFMLQ